MRNLTLRKLKLLQDHSVTNGTEFQYMCIAGILMLQCKEDRT